jgi:hypothetical protein
MKLARIICLAGILLLSSLAVAQDADKQKLIEIEKAFAENPRSGPTMAALAERYLYDGPINQVTGTGRVGTLPKLVSYKMTKTDAGHKDPALDSAFHYGCLDTFVRRNGQWYFIGNACTPDTPMPQWVWDGVEKARAQHPVPEHEIYH